MIIFAAGHGTRLRPLTDKLPKPLIEIRGLSLIEIHLLRLADAGFRRVIVNLHHLGDQIRTRLGDGSRYKLEITYSVEKTEALETAGGIVHALDLIESEIFAAISSDVLCDFPLSSIPELPMSNVDGHLVMVPNPEHHPEGDFELEESGRLCLRDTLPNRPALTFSGIACFRKSLFNELSAGKRPLRPILEETIGQHRLSGELHQGLWSDIGNLERLEQARQSTQVSEYISSVRAASS